MEGHGGKKRSLRDYLSSQTKENKSNENDGDQGVTPIPYHASGPPLQSSATFTALGAFYCVLAFGMILIEFLPTNCYLKLCTSGSK